MILKKLSAMRIVLINFMLFTFTLVTAQTAEQDLSKVLEPLLKGKHIYYENIYYYYEEGEKTPSDTLVGIFHRNGVQEYIKMGNVEILETGKLTVMADHEDRLVSVRQSAQSVSLNKMFDAKQLQSLVETKQMHVKYATGKEKNTALLVTDPDKPKEKMTIVYDPKTWAVEELTIVSRDIFTEPFETDVRYVTIVVKYKHFTTMLRPFGHSIGQYVQKKGDRYITTGKCKGYSVL